MPCQKCGGRKSVGAVAVKAAQTSSLLNADLIKIVYTGPETQKRTFHPPKGHTYSVVKNKPFVATAQDAPFFLSMKYFEQILTDPITAPVEESITLDTQQQVFDIPQFLTGKRDSIEELNISLPTLGMLKKYNFKTISELDQKSDSDLMTLKGFGKGRVAEIRKAIALWKS